MTKKLILALVLASFGVSVGAYFELRHPAAAVRFETALVTRGDIAANVVSTGTLQAVKTVDVGTQANGIIKELDADFNSVVHKGQVIARLDPSLIQAQIDQDRATVEKAKADVERSRVALDDANRQLARAQALFAKQLLDQSDLDTARVTTDQAAADLKAAQAQVVKAQASVDQNLVNLDHTIITAPIDGIVIARNVDVGQTVVSNMQAQTMFEIAEDLSKMQVDATVDESDIGRVREGDGVRFTVDAYPGVTFPGTVAQVRLNPHVDQNVVTYDTLIRVPNPYLKLRPGMTANVTVQVASRQDVVRVPANALLFKPNEELFAALHEAVPAAARADRPAGKSQAAARPGQVWMFRNNLLAAVPVQGGLTDGTNTELASGRLQPGDAVVLNVLDTNSPGSGAGKR
jgi:HlyD family secretion protein